MLEKKSKEKSKTDVQIKIAKIIEPTDPIIVALVLSISVDLVVIILAIAALKRR